ncbi:MAG: EutN/CcmL family microcompartment protein [Firmicutes bacterium]|jgi:ethanolamine utilization protein EutN|nr:EutN/CcmL family microcompartment protein [Bacillota bacterium]HOB21339.1 EutN/CcmL family microcompartment protein [Bacillota bacterium]HQD39697.1 EutN/CcmL family microcompartment protein [Bacillota bacterium]
MYLAKVVGTVVATRKQDTLVGSKLMLVAPYEGEGQTIVAVDTVGAGVGEVVLLTLGNPARNAVDRNSPVDAAIVGIVDSVERK